MILECWDKRLPAMKRKVIAQLTAEGTWYVSEYTEFGTTNQLVRSNTLSQVIIQAAYYSCRVYLKEASDGV